MMSSLVYGSLSAKRVSTKPGVNLRYILKDDDGGAPANTTAVTKWQDVLAGLVPAEVLALHAVAMSLGTKTTGSGDTAKTVITQPDAMIAVYIGMLVLSFALYLVGAKSYGAQDLARALVPPLAFVCWTMIQPSTAFDAFPVEMTTFVRVMIATFGAIVLSVAVKLLADQAEQAA